ncbi:MAG: PilZ domain-containing protein [Acidobacteriota bacterium]
MSSRRTCPDGDSPTATERRRTRRREAYGAFIAVEAPSVSKDFCWSATLIDISGGGMALSLPPELFPGVKLLLSFGLGPSVYLNRVPAVVIRLKEGVGAVRFETWPEDERLKLLSYLLDD